MNEELELIISQVAADTQKKKKVAADTCTALALTKGPVIYKHDHFRFPH